MPDSPDLDPKLKDALLTSLASWDPRASVPLALSFMARGDSEALDGFSRLMQSSPGADSMLEDRYLSPTPDVDALRRCPEGVCRVSGREQSRCQFIARIGFHCSPQSAGR